MVTCTQEFEFLAESIPQLVWIKNQDGSMAYLSKKWSEYTGVSIEDKTWDWTQAIHPDDFEKIIFCWNECVAAGNVFQYECRIRKNDGTYRWYLANAAPRTDSNGHIVWIGTCTDTHDYRIREEYLSEKNKEIEKINSELSHYIFNAFFSLKDPIANIEGLTLALRDDLKMKMDENQKILIELIDRSVGKIKGAVNGLSKINTIREILYNRKSKKALRD